MFFIRCTSSHIKSDPFEGLAFDILCDARARGVPARVGEIAKTKVSRNIHFSNLNTGKHPVFSKTN